MTRRPARTPPPRRRASPPALAAAAGVTALLLAFGAFQIYDYDLPLHLVTGEQLLKDPSTAGVEIFSFTFPGYEWLNDKWLENVIVHLVETTGGARGLVLFRMALVLALGLAVWKAMEAEPGPAGERDDARRLGPAVALSLLPLVAYERFTLRPELFSLVLLALLLWIAAGDRRGRRSWIAAGALFALWVNLHGYWFVGLLALGALLAGDLLEWGLGGRGWPPGADRGEARDRAARRGALLLAAAGGALVSPWPLRLFWNPFEVLLFVGRERGAMETIAELRSPFSPDLTRNLAIWFFYLGAGMVAAALLSRVTRARPGHLLLAGGFLAMACVWRRNIGTFAVAGAIATVWILRSMPPQGRRLGRLRRVAPPLLLLLAAVDLAVAWTVVTDRFYRADGTSRRTGLSMSVYTYPKGMADFLLRERPPGRFFNDFASGSYLAYRLYPDYLIYISGNTFKYPPEFFDEYSLVSLGGDHYKRVADRYGLTGFALQYMATDMMPLASRLFNDGGYVACHFDDNALYFARRIPEMEAFIEEHRVDFAAVARRRAAQPLPPAPRGLLAGRPDPRGELNRATFLHRVGLFPMAEVEYRRAVDMDGSIPEAREGLGEVILAQSRFREALEILEPLCREQPDNTHLVRDLAQAHSGLGSTAAAEADWEAARAGLESALEAILRAREMDPDGDPMTPLEASNRFNLALVLWRAGGAAAGRVDRELQAALALQPGDPELRYRVARIRAGQGRSEEALELLGTALGERPDLRDLAARDPSFGPLASDPRFRALLAP